MEGYPGKRNRFKRSTYGRIPREEKQVQEVYVWKDTQGRNRFKRSTYVRIPREETGSRGLRMEGYPGKRNRFKRSTYGRIPREEKQVQEVYVWKDT